MQSTAVGRAVVAWTTVLTVGACAGADALQITHTASDAGTAPDAAAQPVADAGDSGPSSGLDAGTFTPHAGATIHPDGVAFRLWAPNAATVDVRGDFAEGSIRMTKAAQGGYFEAKVPGAHAGSRYTFLVDPDTRALTRLDPYCREVTQQGDCRVVDATAFPWTDAGFVRPKRENSVVYELHVGSFAVPGGATQGTFATAKASLASLASLGVNVIELMPVHQFGGNPNGWGYNPHLYFAPKASYGTADDLRALVNEAHRLGIGVWLDLVVNHYDGWKGAPLHCFDGHCPADDKAAGIYFFGKGSYAETPWGPRFAFPDPDVANLLADTVEQWHTEFHGDGIRWDSTSNIRGIDGAGTVPGGRELMLRGNAITHAKGGISVAEDLKGYDMLTRPEAQGGFAFDAQWDGFGYDVGGVLAAANDDARDLGAIERALKNNFAGDGLARLLFTENHDTVGNGGARLPSRIDAQNPTSFRARRLSMLGAALLFTTPGMPMLFMGQESLASGTFLDPPAALVTPAAGSKVRAFYRDLISLRRNMGGNAASLATSNVETLQRNDAAKVIGYRRFGGGNDEVIVLVNLSDKNYTRYDIGVPNSGNYRIRVTSDNATYGDDFATATNLSTPIATIAANKDGKPYTLPIAIGPYSAVILTR